MSGPSEFRDISEPDKMSTISPKTKNKKGKYVSSGQKIIVINMFKDITSKSSDGKYDYMINISQTKDIGSQTFSRTIAEYKRTKTVSSPNKKRTKKSLFDKTDDLDRNGSRQKVHAIWLHRELPTIDKILHEVKEDPWLLNFKRTSLFNIIKKLDFVFAKRKRCIVLTEREDLINWHRNYLYDVRKYREEGRTIYHLDETWLNAGDCVDRVWMDKTVHSKHDAFNKGLKLIQPTQPVRENV